MSTAHPSSERVTHVFDTGANPDSSEPAATPNVSNSAGSSPNTLSGVFGAIGTVMDTVRARFSSRRTSRDALLGSASPDAKLIQIELTRWVRENVHSVAEDTVDTAVSALGDVEMHEDDIARVQESVGRMITDVKRIATLALVKIRMDALHIPQNVAAASIVKTPPSEEDIDNAVETAFSPIFAEVLTQEPANERVIS
ncbi:MAG: hypothetical protein HOG89_00640 [Candidatus Peribacter sp.]|jgi:hypothetical protein|nr:hypothetical protein [Candidatus Peribacter sp.]MBT4392968.1 hypothetical protein [Candidatus Peribacter sp.]MBT4601028.1 hypothetical protein [Candidatus Peribacter sp.]MBT5149610.1 hypothetical protein [Candidatus Peribacter sp.]MBT5637484.1 hypothetical protein [Candidatus Peribacter sp.]